MNRLRNQRVYLAGAMDRVADRGFGWRDSITPFLNDLGVVVFNPLNKPGDLGAEDDTTHQVKNLLKQSKKYDELSHMMKTIRAVNVTASAVSAVRAIRRRRGTWTTTPTSGARKATARPEMVNVRPSQLAGEVSPPSPTPTVPVR